MKPRRVWWPVGVSRLLRGRARGCCKKSSGGSGVGRPAEAAAYRLNSRLGTNWETREGLCAVSKRRSWTTSLEVADGWRPRRRARRRCEALLE